MKILVGFSLFAARSHRIPNVSKKTRSLGMTLSKELHSHITSQANGHWIRQYLWFFVLHISKSMSSFFSRKTYESILLLHLVLFQRPEPRTSLYPSMHLFTDIVWIWI